MLNMVTSNRLYIFDYRANSLINKRAVLILTIIANINDVHWYRQCSSACFHIIFIVLQQFSLYVSRRPTSYSYLASPTEIMACALKQCCTTTQPVIHDTEGRLISYQYHSFIHSFIHCLSNVLLPAHWKDYIFS